MNSRSLTIAASALHSILNPCQAREASAEAHDPYARRVRNEDWSRQKRRQLAGAWTVTGGDVLGDAIENYFGREVELSNDGLSFVTGMHRAECGAGKKWCGAVRVYSRADASSSWVQKGQTVSGIQGGAEWNNGEWFGNSCTISGDGLTWAASGPHYEGKKGRIQVYRWNSSTSQWDQMGSDFVGDNADDRFGWIGGLSLSDDGNRLAIGAYLADSPSGSNSGFARIFEWDGSGWSQMGSDINGAAAGDNFGRAVDLTANGNNVVISGVLHDGKGHFQFYNWNGSAWTQIGPDIDGETADDWFGTSLKVNKAGNVVAVGAWWNDGGGDKSGHVRVFEWTGGGVQQMGADIDGPSANFELGTFGALALSADGHTVAVGSELGEIARVYEWSGTSWVQVGGDLTGKASGDTFGVGMSISSDGKTVAVGAPNYDNLRGYVQVFSLVEPKLEITVDAAPVSIPLSTQLGYKDADNGIQDTAENSLGAAGSTSVAMVGNLWKAVEIPGGGIVVRKGTHIEFDFSLTESADSHSICLDNDLQLGTDRYYCFCMANTETMTVNNGFYTQIIRTAQGESKRYKIPIWKYFLGTFQYLVFVQNSDTTPSQGQSTISNIEFYTAPPNTCVI